MACVVTHLLPPAPAANRAMMLPFFAKLHVLVATTSSGDEARRRLLSVVLK